MRRNLNEKNNCSKNNFRLYENMYRTLKIMLPCSPRTSSIHNTCNLLKLKQAITRKTKRYLTSIRCIIFAASISYYTQSSLKEWRSSIRSLPICKTTHSWKLSSSGCNRSPSSPSSTTTPNRRLICADNSLLL